MGELHIFDPKTLVGKIKTDIQAPEKIYISFCPKTAGTVATKANNCMQCQHWKGWLQVQVTGSWSERFRCVCAHPMSRKMFEVE